MLKIRFKKMVWLLYSPNCYPVYNLIIKKLFAMAAFSNHLMNGMVSIFLRLQYYDFMIVLLRTLKAARDSNPIQVVLS